MTVSFTKRELCAYKTIIAPPLFIEVLTKGFTEYIHHILIVLVNNDYVEPATGSIQVGNCI